MQFGVDGAGTWSKFALTPALFQAGRCREHEHTDPLLVHELYVYLYCRNLKAVNLPESFSWSEFLVFSLGLRSREVLGLRSREVAFLSDFSPSLATSVRSLGFSLPARFTSNIFLRRFSASLSLA